MRSANIFIFFGEIIEKRIKKIEKISKFNLFIPRSNPQYTLVIIPAKIQTKNFGFFDVFREIKPF